MPIIENAADFRQLSQSSEFVQNQNVFFRVIGESNGFRSMTTTAFLYMGDYRASAIRNR